MEIIIKHELDVRSKGNEIFKAINSVLVKSSLTKWKLLSLAIDWVKWKLEREIRKKDFGIKWILLCDI